VENSYLYLLKYIFVGFHTLRALISGVIFQIILYPHIDSFIAKVIPEVLGEIFNIWIAVFDMDFAMA